MSGSVAELVGPSLERICEAASGRKFTTLRHEAKEMLAKLDEFFKAPMPVAPQQERRKVALPVDSIEVQAQLEKERLVALMASRDQERQPAVPHTVPREDLASDSTSAAGSPGNPPAVEGSQTVQLSVDENDGVRLAISEAAAAAEEGEAEGVEGAAESTEHASAVDAAPGAARQLAAQAGEAVEAEGKQSPAEDTAASMQEAVSLSQVSIFKGSMSLEAAKELLEILRVAVESRKVQLVDIALDLIQKLIAYKHLQGPVHSISHRRDPAGKGARRRLTEDDDDLESNSGDTTLPQATAVELLCRCDDIADDGVELRVLKGLLTAVTSGSVHVHGQALLLAVRTCYNIFLMSRSEVNQTTAKASLTQMLNVVFQRMEAGSESVHVSPLTVTDQLGLPPAESSSVTAFVTSFLHEVVSTVDPFGYYAENIQQRLDDAFVKGDASSQGDRTEHDSPSADENPAFAVSSAEDSVPGPGPAAVASPAVHSLASPQESRQGSPRAQDQANGNHKEKAEEAAGDAAADAPLRYRTASVESILQKDAFLVFRALCKLSIRSTESTAGTDPTVLRGKVLALELVKILLENSGPVFRHLDKFVAAIKQYLCLSLLKNVTSSIPQAQALTCSIFFTLITKFRHSLKAEIGVFFPMILLRIVEPGAQGTVPNTGGPTGAPAAVDLAHKAVVMRCLEALCDNGQLLVDVFVNYDCDLEGANLFERLVLALVRIAQGTQDKEAQASASQEELAMRLAALSCLVRILRALVEWYSQTTPQVVAADAPALEDSATEEGVQKDWHQLLSLPSGGQDTARASTTGDGVESPRLGLSGSMKRDPASSLFVSLTAPLDAEIQAQLKDADPQREAQLLESWKAYKRGFQEGIALFNKKPKKGIAFMQEQGMLGREPEEVAKFLAKTAGLNKTMIGEYLGEREEFCLKVMHAYVDALNFTGKDFDVAIRMFLDGFRLPGEAQKIDRLMEKFAERYVNCNGETFKSADVAYVLAYSVIMLNTDAHNPQVKTKMTKQDFLRNNRGINDGSDLPEEYMSELYDCIVRNEIKMKDSALDMMASQQSKAAGGWMDTILNLIPGRKQQASNEPSEESIKRTHDFLREKAKGATFFEATEGETVRPMLDVCWAPMLGAFSVLFEEFTEGVGVNMCLAGLVAAIRITSLLGMGMLRNAFVTSICRLTMLHAPASMQVKNAKAFRALLVVADENGNHLHEVWQEVMRCVSRWDLLQQLHSGGPSDAVIFAQPSESPTNAKKRNFFSLRPSLHKEHGANGKVTDSVNSIHEVSLHYSGRGKGGKGDALEAAPPDIVLQEIDAQELNRVFVRSDQLDSEAIVEFVRALMLVAEEELQPVNHPRVYSLTKIVEISHFNMGRIRLVWNRIWAVLADFFVQVGCHKNLQVAMYAVDSLRQLAMKFLERDELANYSFQTAFLTPLVVVMRQSKAVEIRELIIRCVSQMVLARVNNVKSGWKSMFMVFTTAASDESQMIVRLAFDTIEKIVREHFDYITETEVTTFTDCVNCLIAFTNNPHSLDVSLNAIAFLRFCAMKLAEGAIGDVEELPEGTKEYNPSIMRIRPSGQEADPAALSPRQTDGASTSAPASPAANGYTAGGEGSGSVMKFSDKDEHVYFWFPLLAGLSELTFDPRPDIRYSALEVLFDTLKFHGAAFTTPFWMRIFDSVLLPIFDHVRAEVTDTTTFTDEKRRAEVDAWLYETCTKCLQHMVDLVVQFYGLVQPLLSRILDLLSNFIRRPHQSLASVGVAALARLALCAGDQMSEAVWEELLTMLANCSSATLPDIKGLLTSGGRRTLDATSAPAPDTQDAAWNMQIPRHSPRGQHSGGQRVPLTRGSGARRLMEAKCRISIQLLMVQACGEIWQKHAQRLNLRATVFMLDMLAQQGAHARAINSDSNLRRELAIAQLQDKVPAGREVPDPPLLRLESEAGHAYLSVLNYLTCSAPQEVQQGAQVEARLMQLCSANLERFEAAGVAASEAGPSDREAVIPRLASVKEEASARAPLVVATLRALSNLSDASFRRHLRHFFPLLTRLIACQHAPPDVQLTLSELFTKRIGPLLAQ